MISADLSGLADLAEEIAGSYPRVEQQLVATTKRGAHNIAEDARQRISGHRRLPHYPRSITYDVTVDGDVIEAEVGPDKDRPQGPLGNILEFGTSKAPPMPHLLPALDAEEPRWVDHIVRAAGDIL